MAKKPNNTGKPHPKWPSTTGRPSGSADNNPPKPKAKNTFHGVVMPKSKSKPRKEDIVRIKKAVGNKPWVRRVEKHVPKR